MTDWNWLSFFIGFAVGVFLTGGFVLFYDSDWFD